MNPNTTAAMVMAVALLLHGGSAQAFDAAAADKLARKSKCLTCHGVDRKKDGPSFKETADKYKGKADAVSKVTDRITKPGKVKIDGADEEHETLKTKDPAEVSNVVEWILSL